MSPLSMLTMMSKFASWPYFLRTIWEKVSSMIPWSRSLSMFFWRAISANASMIICLLALDFTDFRFAITVVYKIVER